MDEDYMKFLGNLDYYLSTELRFIDPHKGRYYSKRMARSNCEITYPVGVLGDIEVWFIHYQSEEEAKKKWERRIRRFEKINNDNILIKWSERYDYGEEHLKKFIELPFKHKIAFVTPILKKKFQNYDYVISIPELEFLNIRGGDETESINQHFDVLKLINSLNNKD